MNRSPITKRKRVNDCVGKAFLFILLPSFFGLTAGRMYLTIPDRYQTEVDFRARALLTSGIVTGKEYRQTTCIYGACTTNCSVTVKFKTNTGRTVIFNQTCPSSVRENQTVPVLYNPDVRSSAPVQARIEQGDNPESYATGELVISLVLALFGVISLAAGFSIYRTKRTQT